MKSDKRKLARKNFSYYMRVLDERTGNLIGQLSDISTGGFKIESTQPIAIGTDFQLRIDQTNEISNKSFLSFTARVKWCAKDSFDPTIYNVGFQLVDMTPSDYDVFVKMFNEYGVQQQAHHKSNSDYLWG